MKDNNANEITLEEARRDLYYKLKEQFKLLQKEQGYQVILTYPRLGWAIKIFWLILIMGFLTGMIASKVKFWENFDKDEKYVGNDFPWGVIFVIVSLPVILVQNVGYSSFN